MRNLFKSFGLSLTGIGVVFMFGAASAADTGRASYNVASANRATFSGQQRMPTMSILPTNATGNVTTNTNTANAIKCPDGGVQTSDYTIENCMNDVLSCVNNGALPGGLNDLFNQDLRNSILNGMNLCSVQVDKCLSDVRKNCQNVYRTTSDFWLDFNSRKIQPEYYSFVLRKTGLTPNQAENTCWLLDKNVYGSSFDAVSNTGAVTSEYNKQIGAYNSQGGGSLIKDSPQGVRVNTNGSVDGQRGHYARWDAATGECLVRVAAYNKNSQIKNSWLFGAAGNDQPAEVWKNAGSSFTCGKDIFGFGLMTNTKTTAVVGVGGGTLVGAGVGALAGHGERRFDCDNATSRKALSDELRDNRNSLNTLNKYLNNEFESFANDTMSERQCESIVKLYNNYEKLKSLNPSENDTTIVLTKENFKSEGSDFNYDIYYADNESTGKPLTDVINSELKDNEKTDLKNNLKVTKIRKEAIKYTSLINQNYYNGVYCEGGNSEECVSGGEIKTQIGDLSKIFSGLGSLDNIEKSNMLASTAIGAGAGAAAGGLATAITAFVEKNNINCRVGDGLQKVDYGKSYSIGSLKDFYVKWNLRLPDTIMPTATATDCASWTKACETLKDLNQCTIAQVNYKPVNSMNTTLVNTACAVSGSTCTVNYPVAVSNSACQ
ncbi:MAG: hypothetical protein JW985_02160 [Alphaproteobacteria bacterium]|nr:hypothetical protein [Alphaproteobacteria bacterium]